MPADRVRPPADLKTNGQVYYLMEYGLTLIKSLGQESSNQRVLSKPMSESSKERSLNFRRFAQRIRVPIGFIFAPLVLIAARPTIGSLIAGSFVALSGLAIRAWASGHLKKNEEMATRGPYAHTRNPLYFGTLLMGGGVTVSTGTFWLVALFVVLYLIIYLPVMLAEAETVHSLFPEEYMHYSRQVPLFLPRLKPYRFKDTRPAESLEPSPHKGFDSTLYLRHREYRAAIGLIAVYAVLAAKFYIFGGQ